MSRTVSVFWVETRPECFKQVIAGEVGLETGDHNPFQDFRQKNGWGISPVVRVKSRFLEDGSDSSKSEKLRNWARTETGPMKSL